MLIQNMECFNYSPEWGSSHSHSSKTDRAYCISCHICGSKALSTERDYVSHITHLRRNENVPCPFLDCLFQSIIYGTFKSDKSRKHTPHTYVDFMPGIVKTTRLATQTDVQSSDLEEVGSEEVSAGSSSTGVHTEPTEL